MWDIHGHILLWMPKGANIRISADIFYGSSGDVRPRIELGPLRSLAVYSYIPNSGDLQRELRAFVFLSEDYGEHYSGPCPPDLRLMVRMSNVKLPD